MSDQLTRARAHAARTSTATGSRDPFVAAAAVGLDVVEAALPPGCHGVLSKAVAQCPRLLLAAGETTARRRWTVARATGLVLTHRDEGVELYEHVDPWTGWELIDMVGTEFAAELLMPAVEFAATYERGNVGQAILFDVPVSVVRPRAIDLGLPRP